MYCLYSCDGTPVFFASLRVGVGQNANRFEGRRTSSPAASRLASSFIRPSVSSYDGSPCFGKYPYPVPDVGGAELGRGETFPFRIVPERVKVL